MLLMRLKEYNLKKLRSCVIHYTEQTPVFFDEPMVKNFELFEGERRPFLQVKTYIQMLGLHNIVSLEDDALRFSEHYQYSAGELAKIAILRSLVLKKSDNRQTAACCILHCIRCPT